MQTNELQELIAKVGAPLAVLIASDKESQIEEISPVLRTNLQEANNYIMKLIADHDFEELVSEYNALVDQDGWETAELTVTHKHPKRAAAILKAIHIRRG